MVEMTVMLVLFLVFIFGVVEFMLIFWQWNSAVKAVQFGARLAAVSNPVATNLRNLSGLSSSVNPGDPMPSFDISCDGATQSCTPNQWSYDATAMNNLVYGRDDSGCALEGGALYRMGMCDFFYKIRPANVLIRYQQTGLGFAGRPGGPVPTIIVSLQNIRYDYLFLRIIGLNTLNLPGLTTTITGEDLSSGAPAP